MNKFNLENFIMIIKSAGFIQPGMIGSKNALNFAYALYLRLRAGLFIGRRRTKEESCAAGSSCRCSRVAILEVLRVAGNKTFAESPARVRRVSQAD